jgi:hypothetical protein
VASEPALACFAVRDLKQLLPQLTTYPADASRFSPIADSSLDHVYFPDSGVVSVVAVYSDGSIIEMATIGREGCTGVQPSSVPRFFCSVPHSDPGSAAQMSREAFARAMRQYPPSVGWRLLTCKPFKNKSWYRQRAMVRMA